MKTRKDLEEALAASTHGSVTMTIKEYEDTDFFCDEDIESRKAMDSERVLIAAEPWPTEEDMYSAMASVGIYTGQ
jgi:hypothetical protein